MSNTNTFLDAWALKSVKVQIRCYLDTTPALVANPACKYILRDKSTNKEIVPWKFVKYHGNQKADVCLDPIEQAKFHDFLNKVGSDEDLGHTLKNRESKEFSIIVSGVFLSQNDTCVNLMNPVFFIK